MSARIKFDVVLKSDNVNGGCSYRCPALGVDGHVMGTFGQALDKCLNGMHSAFSGVLTGEHGERVRIFSSHGAVNFSVEVNLIKEEPLSKFGVSESSEPGPVLAQTSVSDSGSKKAKVKA